MFHVERNFIIREECVNVTNIHKNQRVSVTLLIVRGWSGS